LNPGSYTLKASSIGYELQEKTLELTESLEDVDFELPKLVQAGVHGKTFLSDGLLDNLWYGIRIHVNGVFRTQSRFFPLGEYELSLTSGKEYNLTFSYPDYESQTIIKSRFP